jgi:hypothetical protein
MPLLRFDPAPKQAVLRLAADGAHRSLYEAIKSVLLRLRDDDIDPPRSRAFRTLGNGLAHYVTVSADDDSWAVAWRRLEDGSRGIIYIGPDDV